MVSAVAKKGVKRTAPEAKSAKESKQTKVDPNLKPVIEAVDSSSVPEGCKAMLRVAIPNSLCVASDLRSANQARFVEMIAEVIESVTAHLQSALDTAEGSLVAATSSKEEKLKKTQETVAIVASAKDVVSVKQAAVLEAQAAVSAACEALRAAKEAQEAGDAPFNECEARCRDIKAAIETIKSEAANESPESLLEVLRKCDAPEALLVSMPATLAQTSSQRSDFENIAVTAAEKCLTDGLALQTASLEEGAEAKKHRASIVEEAEQAQERARIALEKANGEKSDADADQQKAAEAYHIANAERRDSDLEVAKKVSERDEAHAQLDHFVNHNVASFDRLRHSVSTDDAACRAGA